MQIEIGKKYGFLVAISPSLLDGRKSFIFECVCGRIKNIRTSDVLTKGVKSCNCMRGSLVTKEKTKHGESVCQTPEYMAWKHILQRCSQRNGKDAKYYFDRGIEVCARWKLSFNNFLEDMGRRPRSGMSIDRKNNNLGYGPGNCRWATAEEQSQNRRNVIAANKRKQ